MANMATVICHTALGPKLRENTQFSGHGVQHGKPSTTSIKMVTATSNNPVTPTMIHHTLIWLALAIVSSVISDVCRLVVVATVFLFAEEVLDALFVAVVVLGPTHMTEIER